MRTAQRKESNHEGHEEHEDGIRRSFEYADELDLPYIGADAIAATLNPLNPAAVQTAAARQFIRTIEEHISLKNPFVCESTLSGLTMQNFVASARDAGYVVSIAFLFVHSADVCVARVAERVRAPLAKYPTWIINMPWDARSCAVAFLRWR